jgi:hypothetical protein
MSGKLLGCIYLLTKYLNNKKNFTNKKIYEHTQQSDAILLKNKKKLCVHHQVYMYCICSRSSTTHEQLTAREKVGAGYSV